MATPMVRITTLSGTSAEVPNDLPYEFTLAIPTPEPTPEPPVPSIPVQPVPPPTVGPLGLEDLLSGAPEDLEVNAGDTVVVNVPTHAVARLNGLERFVADPRLQGLAVTFDVHLED